MARLDFQEGWYVVYTKPRHEKRVYDRLSESITTYLPLTKSLRKWSDRNKWVEVPLFNSYVFVYLQDLSQYFTALDSDGVCWFVTVSGKPAMVPDIEIERIKYLLGHSDEIQVIGSKLGLHEGDSRTINFGPLSGLDCEVVRYDGKEKVLVKIDSLDQILMVEINSKFLIPQEELKTSY